jgi:hypothetical protein
LDSAISPGGENPHLVRRLLAAGADVNAADSFHSTPVILAAVGGNAES